MGLLSSSKEIRENLLVRNLYTPTNPYDLQGDAVTRTLNTLSNLGFDLRSRLVPSFLERSIDNTKLVQVANERLLVEFGRRAAGNIIKDNIGVFTPAGVFDGDPSTGLFTKREDFSITPKRAGENKGVKGIIDALTDSLGYSSGVSILESPAIIPGEYGYVQYMGKGQRKSLFYNMYQNYYNLYAPYTVRDSTTKNNISKFLGSDTPSQSYLRTTINIESDKILSNFKDFTYSTLNVNSAEEEALLTSLNKPQTTVKKLDELGFGHTYEGKTAFNEETGAIKDTSLFWEKDGLQNKSNLKIKRGLLKYTQQLTNLIPDEFNTIDQSKKEFKDSNNSDDSVLLYKGVKCRSWTLKDSYDTLGKAIRFQGNGVNFSVLRDSVVPHEYPTFSDTKDDLRRFMFSFENLAWSDLRNLPECERGYFGGRLMWFPFYGVEFTEDVSVDWNTIKPIGRIEPMYSYNGRERTAQLSFMLVMNYPSSVKGLTKEEMIDYFKGCLEFDNANVVENTTPQTDQARPDVISSITPTNPQPQIVDVTPPNDLTIYFDNDKFSVTNALSDNYETSVIMGDGKNRFALNKTFTDNTTQIVEFLKENVQYCEYTITGYASQLFVNDYNAGLGFRRAYSLMNHVVSEFNSSGSDRQLNLIPPDNFATDYFDNKKDKSGNVVKVTKEDALGGTKFVFTDKELKVKFTILSNGEETSSAEGQSKLKIDAESAKKDRKAVFNTVYLGTKTSTSVFTPEPTSQQIQDEITVNQENDAAATSTSESDCKSFNKVSENTNVRGLDLIAQGFYAPTFHSQTPEDFHKRLTFIHQMTLPGETIKGADIGKNSIFGKQPVCILRIGDFMFTKVIVTNLSISYPENNWDLNPEGMGVQPMIAKVSMSLKVMGGQSLKGPIDRLQRAIDFNFYGNSTFYGKNYYNGLPATQEEEQELKNNSVE